MQDQARIYDELLVLHVQAGDVRALTLLARRWHPRLLRTARRLTGDGETARELAQASWLGILRGISGLRDPALFPAWAFGILRRQAASAIGETIRSRERSAPLGEVAALADGDSADDRIAIADAFASLSPDHRLAASLFFVERLTLAEIAQATGAPVGTVKSRIFHARQSLKRQLSGEQ